MKEGGREEGGEGERGRERDEAMEGWRQRERERKKENAKLEW